VLLAALLIVYLANGRTLGSGDTMPARYLPLSILRRGDFWLDQFPFLYAGCVPYYLTVVGGHYVSVYPVAAALLALPVYLPAALAGVAATSPVIAELEKLAAAAMVALSATLLYRGARRITSRRMALFVTAAYALGSSSLSVSSQALWPHGPSQLGLAAAIYCLLRGREEARFTALAGLPLAFAVIARPTDGLIAVPVAALVLRQGRACFARFLAAGAAPLLFQVWYNAAAFGDPLRTQWRLLDREVWGTPFWDGLAGLTLSPARGLLVYSPIFLLSIAGAALAWRRGGDPLLRALGLGTGLTILLYSRWEMWWGGFTYGPRLLADLTPALALCLSPLDRCLGRRRALAVMAAVLLGFSVGAHAIGAFAHDRYWNAYRDVDRFPEHLWSWTDNPLVNPLRLGLGRARIVLGGAPTSARAPELLSAAYATRLPARASLAASASLDVALTAMNDGRAAWLAWPRRRPGTVALQWRWSRVSDAAVVSTGLLPLYHDVASGSAHDFRFLIEAPAAPGAYELEIRLGRIAAGCAEPLGARALRVAVMVDPLRPAGEGPRAPSRGPKPCGRGPLLDGGAPPCPAGGAR
jgi:hypothetical protein